MATATIPVDLRNPGQVFACLGFMEAAEVLIGPAEGGFAWEGTETEVTFTLSAQGPDDPVRTALAFLARAEVKALAPKDSPLSTANWRVKTIAAATADRGDTRFGEVFPCQLPDSPAALPIILTDGTTSIPIDHFADDFASTGRDNVKFWAGAAGYPGAALARDALQALAALGGNALADAAADPFSVAVPQSSSFRFDWRRDYIPLDAGFSPNLQTAVRMVGFPLVELLAAIGLEHARPDRPDRRDKLTYRYGVSNAVLPTAFARAVLGTADVGFPARIFRMRLGWPGQEGQARCIIDAQEESVP
jgi:CRISPR-associated protein Csx14